MTIHQSRVARLRGVQETTYNTEVAIGSFLEIPANIDSIAMELMEPMEQPGHVIQRLDQRSLPVLMPRVGSHLKFGSNLETFTTKATSTVAATKHWLGTMLEAAFGDSSVRLTTGTLISGSGSSTTVLNVVSATTHRAGACVGLTDPTTGLLHMREIASVDTGAAPDTITLKMALPFTPADGATVLGCATYFLHNNPNGVDPEYMQFAAEGYDPSDRWLLTGCALASLGFGDLSPGAIPRINWDWEATTWASADGASTTMNLVGATLGRGTYINTILNTIRSADLRLRAYGSSALPSFLHATKVTLEPKIEYELLRSPDGTGTVRGFRRREVYPEPALKTMIEVPMEGNLTYDTYASSQTELAFTYQIGSSPSRGGVLLAAPRCFISKKPTLIDIGAVRGRGIELFSMQDTEATSAGASEADDALAQAAFRIHFC